MFGRYRHTIDAKNRLFIPAKFREEMGEKLIISRDIADNCLNLYPLSKWTEFEKKINALPSIQLRRVRQFIYSNTCDADADSMGRVIINSQLYDDAGLKKEVMIVGMGEYAQVWDLGEWNRLRGEFEASGGKDDLLARLEELGF